MTSNDNYSIKTKAVHSGQQPESITGAITTPIFQTATYVLEEVEKDRGYQYSRTNNPTRTVLEDLVSDLEESIYGVAFSTGMAAVDAIIRARLKSGDHVICFDDAYGGVYRIFEQNYRKFGLEFDYVDMRDANNVREAIKDNTRLIWLETPTNPLLKIADIKMICKIVENENNKRNESKILSVVDNTFMTPYFLQPFKWGTDIVVHSLTKYLSGHNQLVGGLVVIRDDPSRWYYEERENSSDPVNTVYEDIKFIQNAVGAVLGPMDCWLTITGIKTLAIRMEQHDTNARKIAEFLTEHSKVKKVYYPGLKSHQNYEIGKEQMTGFGGMISFELKDEYGIKGGRSIMNSVRLWALAESLGAVESMITHPATMTHAAVPPEVRYARGISDGLIRLSVGIEDVTDLIYDLEQALNKI
ncbi:MAG: trans-sulfuration enzyme family protein [Candidatus Hodarchaeales archaeon]|jgi:cystathionine beta-lyase/cystathionine gamma-synthase